MRNAQIPKSAAFVGTAVLAAVALLAWFTVIVQQAHTRGEHRRAYQQLTGEIMMPVQTDGRRNAGRRQNAKNAGATLSVAQQ